MDNETKKNDTIQFRYIFTFDDHSRETFELNIGRKDLLMRQISPSPLPEWTDLGYYQCPNCSLSTREHATCPLSASLVNIVKRFDRFLSYNKIHITVETRDRKTAKTTTVQRGVSSLLGLVFATSGCPHLSFFRPMARFHLPFASEEETVYRATSMYLLAQYFLHKAGGQFDHQLEGLTRIYHDVKQVNQSIAKRLRAASQTDSTLNAIVLLDVYAQTVPYVIQSSLEEIRHLFTPYLSQS